MASAVGSPNRRALINSREIRSNSRATLTSYGILGGTPCVTGGSPGVEGSGEK